MKNEIIEFLKQLATTQEQTLSVLQKKQALLVNPDKESLANMTVEENDVLTRLQHCLTQREEILESARKQGHDADSIQTLCEQLFPLQIEWRKLIEVTIARSRQIRYLAFTNWTMTQKSLIHLTQILDIIETRGQGKTTYKPPKGNDSSNIGGGFVDRVA